MAERNMLFTLQRGLFNEIWPQSDDFLELRHELNQRQGFSLSRSLLTWETSGNWHLVDFGKENVYYIEINNDEVEVSEEIGVWGSEEIEDWGAIRSLLIESVSLHTVYGSDEGFIDWLLTLVKLRVVTFDQSGLDNFKRTDLSRRKLSFEIVHPDLLAAYGILQEILIAPRESLVGLSKNNIYQIRDSLRQLLNLFQEINNFNPQHFSREDREDREKHKELRQKIALFYDEVKQELRPIVASLQSKKVEQLETQVEATIASTVTEAVEKLNTETDRLQKQGDQAKQNEAKRQEEFDQFKVQLQDSLAKESVSEYGEIFKEQANKHKWAAYGWFGSTVLLIIGFCWIFYWLFNVLLRLEGTGWVGVFQNVFTKGFFLSLVYLLLNRSIKNYNAQKHLEVINRHRQNALDTFERFVSSAARQETKEEVLLAATNAIFDANQSGYLSAKMRGNESASPILQVIKAFTPRASSTRPD